MGDLLESDDSNSTIALEPFETLLKDSGLNLTESESTKVVEKLISLGAETIECLKLLTERDLLDVLPILKSRKLLNFIATAHQTNASSQSIPASSSSLLFEDDRNHLNTDDDPSSSTSAISLQQVDVPLEKFSSKVRLCLQNKTRPTPQQRREIVRVLSDMLMENEAVPPKYKIRVLIENFVRKYPSSFEDHTFGDNEVQSDVHSLKIQVENRIYNMNRQSSSSSDTTESTKKSKKAKLAMGTYNPVNVLSDEEVNELKAKLIKMYEEQASNDQIQPLIIKCFPVIRNIINFEPYTVTQLKEEWPILFTLHGLKLQYNMLMKKTLDDVVQSVVKSRSSLIAFMQYFQHKHSTMQSIVKKIHKAKEERGNQAEVIGMVYLLADYFKEDASLIYLKVSEIRE